MSLTLDTRPVNETPNYEAQIKDFFKYYRAPGVVPGALNELEVSSDGSGMNVDVDTGEIFTGAFWSQLDTPGLLSISNGDPTNDRIDRVIVEIDISGDTYQIKVLEGTPAASPVPPAVTSSSTVFRMSLAQVYVDANESTSIAAAKVTDERVYSANYVTLSIIIGNGLEVPSTGILGHIYLPENRITRLYGWKLSSHDGTSGSMVVDIWHDTTRAATTGADSICNAHEPNLSSQAESIDLDIKDWSTLELEGGCLVFNLDSVSAIEQATLTLMAFMYPSDE